MEGGLIGGAGGGGRGKAEYSIPLSDPQLIRLSLL